ncbi:MAG: CBS domain-containing protein [Boseongicola sp.]|nr:CBS domain-containing protein [Boseongicola sp.]
MHIEQILRTKGSDVVTARADETVAQAAIRMEANSIGALVIVDKGDQPIGILSERDIARGINEYGPHLSATPVSSLMSSDVVTCKPKDLIADIMATMTERRIRHLPVMDNGRLAGVVSIGDMVKERLNEIESEASALRSYIAGA